MNYFRYAPHVIKGMISLKVGNLTYRTTEDDLREIFKKYGKVGDVYIPKNRYSGDSRGFAFVRYVILMYLIHIFNKTVVLKPANISDMSNALI